MKRNAFESRTEQSYDCVAADYARRYYDELQHKPFDRAMLDRLAAMGGPLGPICDLGCGPGQVARYLHDAGVEAFGIDLSPGMVAEARRRNPDIAFQPGSMLRLPLADNALGGIAAFYSVIHIPPSQHPAAFAEMRRVLRPGGAVLVTFHLGDEVVHRDEWWEQPVSLDFHLLRREDIEAVMAAVGLRLVESLERDPYPEVENQTRRAYILAMKPEA